MYQLSFSILFSMNFAKKKKIHLLRYVTTKTEVRESFEDSLERDSVLALSLARGFQREVWCFFSRLFFM